MRRFTLRLIGYHLLWWIGVTALTAMFGCASTVKPTLGPVVGCEYFFDHRGVRGYYWMSGPPHTDLWIRACYDNTGQSVTSK